MSNIINNIRNGLFWNFFLAFGRQGLNVIATIFLGRLLCPEDYGLIGMIAIFIAVSEGFVDAGLGGALIKKRDAKSIDFSTLNVYNLVLSVLLFIFIWMIAPYVGYYYDNIEVINLLRLYSLIIIADAFAIVPKIKLQKELKFKQLALSNVISGFCGLLCAVVAALYGMGAYSLVFQFIVTSFLNAIILFKISKYSLSFKFSLSSFKESFVFGFNTSFANMIKDILENLFTNIIAKIAPLSIIGYYTQSYKIQNVLSSIQYKILDGSLFPILSREKDSEIIRLSLKLNNYAQFIFLFFYLGLILSSREIILIILGEDWLSMTPYFNILLFTAIFQSLTSLNRNILKTLAKTKDILLNEIVTLFIVALLLLFIPLTVKNILLILLLYGLIRFVISVIILNKDGIINTKNYFKSLIFVTIIPVFCFVITIFFKYMSCIDYLFIWPICYLFLTIIILNIVKPFFFSDLKHIIFK